MDFSKMQEFSDLYNDDMEWVTMPLNGKKPTTTGWQNLTESVEVSQGQNIGIVCGAASNLTVVDIDIKDKGMEIWERLITAIDIPETPTVKTGSGGLHLYFQYDVEVKTSAKCVTIDWGEVHEKIGIDIRSNKGQVVAPPSVHPEKKTEYTWQIHPEQIEAQFMPAILKELVTGKMMLKFNHKTQKFRIVPFKNPSAKQTMAQENKTYEYEGEEKLRKVVMNLSVQRAENRDDWIKVIFAIGQTARENEVDLSELAIDFSKRSAKFSTEADVLEKYNALGEGITPKTLFWMLKKDNPDMFKEICGVKKQTVDKTLAFNSLINDIISQTTVSKQEVKTDEVKQEDPNETPDEPDEVKQEDPNEQPDDPEEGERSANALPQAVDEEIDERAKRSANALPQADTLPQVDEEPHNWQFSDYKKFLLGEVDTKYVLEYMKEAIPHVINKGSDLIFSKNILDDGSISYHPISVPFHQMNNFPIEYKGNTVPMATLYQGVYLANSYRYMDFVPYLKEDPTPDTTFNIFEGFKYKYDEFQPEMLALITCILYHITHIICGGSEELSEYLLDWIAQIFQHPEDKIGIAILLKSTKQGAGKNVFTDFLMEVLGKALTYTTDRLDDLTNKFNAYMQGKLLVVCDEVANFAGYKLADSLKSNITCTQRPIEVKGKEVFSIACRARYIFTSNSDIPLRISQYDRRYLAIEVSDAKVGDRQYFKNLIEEMKSEDSMRAFFLYMSNRDISKREFRNIPMTALKKELMLESIPSAIQYLMEVGSGEREDNLGEFNKDDVLKVFSVGFYDDYSNWMTQGGYRGTSTKREFVKKLEELGLKKGNVRIGGSQTKGYTIKKADLLAAMRAYMRDDTLEF